MRKTKDAVKIVDKMVGADKELRDLIAEESRKEPAATRVKHLSPESHTSTGFP